MGAAMPRRHLLASKLTLSILTLAAQAGDFIRVDEDDSAARLQTAVIRYEKDDVRVDLIGAIHIADKEYYESLDKRFKDYDALLFEMVGGERLGGAGNAEPADEEAAPADQGAKGKALAGLHKVYGMVSKSLNLTGQMEHIDYRAPNFVHADLTYAEFERMQKERGESLIGFALKAGKDAPEPEKAPNPMRLITALLAGKPDVVKLEIVHTLGQGDDQIAALAGESVILDDRNQRCIEVMDREIAAGKRKLGVFYGAAHLPDLEKRLLEKGFREVKRQWLTAWNIPKPAAAPAAPAAPQDAADDEAA